MRVVLDTNVLVSGVFYPGPPSKIVSAWIEDKFEFVVSAEIIEEYRRVAERIGARFPGIVRAEPRASPLTEHLPSSAIT